MLSIQRKWTRRKFSAFRVWNEEYVERKGLDCYPEAGSHVPERTDENESERCQVKNSNYLKQNLDREDRINKVTIVE